MDITPADTIAEAKLPPSAADDIAYVRASFRPIDEAVRPLVDRGVLPRPTYVLPDGTQMAPEDHAQLLEDAGGDPDAVERHVTTLNAAAGAAPPVVAMTTAGEARTVVPIACEHALCALARDAIDLFTGPLRDRVRAYAAQDCGLLFVDASRPGGRRWCSMVRCGSRAKMRRYRSGSRTGSATNQGVASARSA